MVITEKELKIKTSDKKVIYGILGKSSKKSDTLVIFVHGFTGHRDEHIFFNGSKLFTQKGLDTFRFNLYAGEAKSIRHFRDTTISLHGKDINTVVKYFRNKYKKIFVIGHSYGGTSLLFTNQSLIDKYVFWDASYIDSKNVLEDMRLDKKIDAYIIDWGIEIIVGNKFMKELKNFPDCGKLVKKIQKPTLFITAGKKVKQGAKYFKAANKPKKYVNISTADHNFNNWRDEEKLLKKLTVG